MAAETRKIEREGYSLRVHIEGEGEPGLVLVHGFGDSVAAWDEVAPPLAQKGTVARLELRGHGFSQGPEESCEWEDLGRDPIAVLDALGWSRATLVGHGLGGVTCLLAARGAPERVEKLVLIGTAASASAAQENWCNEILKAGRMNALQGIAHAIFGPMNRKAVEGSAKPMLALARRMQTLHTEPITDHFTGLACPTLLLVGDRDTTQSAELAEALPNATLKTLPGQGHFPHKRDPESVVNAVQAFIDS